MKLLKLSYFVALVAIFGGISINAHGGSCNAGHAHKHAEKASFGDIEHTALKKAINDGTVFLIDVNGSRSFKQGHIPGAVDFASLGKEGLKSVLPEDKATTIVAYCGGPQCRAYMKAAQVAASLGYTDVLHYSGGISGWKGAGEEVETAES